MRRRGLLCVALALGCDSAAACDEDVRAQVLAPRIELVIAGDEIAAEVATSATERERGWRHRRCDREALVLLPDVREPLPVWGCALVDPIDVAFVRDAHVVAWVADVAPCAACGERCPIVGDGIPVDAVLELEAGLLELGVGDPVSGLP